MSRTDAGGQANELSVVVVTHESESWIGRCLESISKAAAGLSFETLVVDSGSRDATREAVLRAGAETRWIPLGENCGYGAALNRGIAESRGELVACLNADVVLGPGCLDTLAAVVREEARFCAAGPLLVDASGVPAPSARGFPTLADEAFEALGVHRLWRSNPVRAAAWRTDLGPGRGGACDQLTGAVLLMRREVFDRVGPFDEEFFLYFEETDWFRRASLSGARARFVPQARAMHGGGGSSGGLGMRRPWYWRSQLRYFRKHGHPLSCLLLRLVQLAGSTARIVAGALRAGPGSAEASRKRVRDARRHFRWVLLSALRERFSETSTIQGFRR